MKRRVKQQTGPVERKCEHCDGSGYVTSGMGAYGETRGGMMPVTCQCAHCDGLGVREVPGDTSGVAGATSRVAGGRRKGGRK